MARESDSSLHRQGMEPELVHDHWPGLGKVVEVVIEGLSVLIEIKGKMTRSKMIFAASLKPFYTWPSDLRHLKEDVFAQKAWVPDLGSEGTPPQHQQCTRSFTGG